MNLLKKVSPHIIKPKFKIGTIVIINNEAKRRGVYPPSKLLRVSCNRWVGNGYTVFFKGECKFGSIHETWLESACPL